MKLMVSKGKNIVKSSTFIYLIYFLLIFFSNINQITFWGVVLFAPLLLRKAGKERSIPRDFSLYFIFLIITLGIILITAVFSVDWLFPLKRGLVFISIVFSSYFLIRRLNSINEVIAFFKAGSIASLIYTLFLFKTLYSGDFSFSWDESSWIGKNSSAPIIFSGFAFSVLLLFLSSQKKYFYFLPFALFAAVLLTGAIKMIITCSVILLVFLLSLPISNVKKIFLTFGSIALMYLLWIKNSNNIIESRAYQITYSRISILFGGEAIVDVSSGLEGRENLAREGMEIFLNNPIMGIGLENTRLYLGTYTHNTFVELLAGGGLFLFISFTTLFIIVFKNILQIRVLNFKLICFVIFLSIVLLANAQRVYDNSIIMALLISLLAVSILMKKKSESKVQVV